jgi:putative transposase
MNEQTVHKTFKYRPTPAQEQAMAFALRRCHERCHERCPAALEERSAARRKRGVSVTEAQQSAQPPEVKEMRPEYCDIHSQVSQDALSRLDRAFQVFFRRVREGRTPGYPRFQGSDRYTSFTHKQFGGGARLDNGFLVLSTIGRLAVRWSRPLEGAPKTITISREADGWSVCFSCAAAPVRPPPPTKQATGLGLRIEAFATLSNGARAFSPGWYRKAERHLKPAQRGVSRRKMGSNRRRKAVTLLAKAHQTVCHQRRDFHHKTALAPVRANDVVSHEDLQTANMLKTHHLAKTISEVGWAASLTILTCKAARARREVIAVNPAFTSQRRSGCGVMVSRGLSARWHSCPDCGMSLRRDHNAARNIECAGQALRGEAA